MFCKSILFALLVVVTVPTTAGSADDSRLAQFERFAEQPVEEVQYWQLIGFETLGDNTVAVWTGVNRVYLVTVADPCPRLKFARAIGVTHTQSHVLSTRFDQVTFDQRRCDIASIRPVDYEALRAAEKRAAAQDDSGSM